MVSYQYQNLKWNRKINDFLSLDKDTALWWPIIRHENYGVIFQMRSTRWRLSSLSIFSRRFFSSFCSHSWYFVTPKWETKRGSEFTLEIGERHEGKLELEEKCQSRGDQDQIVVLQLTLPTIRWSEFLVPNSFSDFRGGMMLERTFCSVKKERTTFPPKRKIFDDDSHWRLWKISIPSSLFFGSWSLLAVQCTVHPKTRFCSLFPVYERESPGQILQIAYVTFPFFCSL